MCNFSLNMHIFGIFCYFLGKIKIYFYLKKIMKQSFKNYYNIIYDINSSYENELCWFFLFIRVYSHFQIFALFLEHSHDF